MEKRRLYRVSSSVIHFYSKLAFARVFVRVNVGYIENSIMIQKTRSAIYYQKSVIVAFLGNSTFSRDEGKY